MKGAVKDGVGSMTGNVRLEREGESENAARAARARRPTTRSTLPERRARGTRNGHASTS